MRNHFDSSRATLTGFIAGALSVPVFHQLAQALAYNMHYFPIPAFSMQPTEPFGIPQLVSISFWGGIWGVVFAYTILRLHGASYWLFSIIGGALLLTGVAAFVVSPLKDMGMMWGWNQYALLFGFYVNGAWGLGVAMFYGLFNR